MLLQTPIAPEAVRDTIARIVIESGYRSDAGPTLLSRAWEWFWRYLREFFRSATQSRGTYIIALAIIALVITTVIIRAIIVARARRLAAAHRDASVSASDLYAQSQSLATQGAFANAAHLLYAAVVSSLVEKRKVRHHPSKTIGDYGRELRAQHDADFDRYQRFANAYEVVAYGDGLCDAERYTRLEQLALPMLPRFTALDTALDTARAA